MNVHGIGRAAAIVLSILFLARSAGAAPPDPEPDWFVGGGKDGICLGASVSTAGDVNGDGFGDVIAGAPLYHTFVSTPGQVRVYLGSASGLATTPAWTRLGSTDLEHFGSEVAAAGDVNGDGFDDVLVGAPDYTNGQNEEGKVQLFLGSASGLGSSPAWTVESNDSYSMFGTAIAGGGDLNADGFDDVLIGAYDFANGQTSEGRVFVYHGSPGGLPAAPSATREIDVIGARFGKSVALGGDVNGDGFDDAVIGAWTFSNGENAEGVIYLYPGSATGLAATPIWQAEGGQANGYFGGSVSIVGDMNGDGYADVAAGGFLYDTPELDGGQVRVYFGSAGGAQATPALTLNAGQAQAGFGGSVATAGDVDGDGYADLLVGAYTYDGAESDEGLVRLYRGGPAGLSDVASYHSVQTSAHLGSSVMTAGDVNGDGFSDVLAGSPNYDGLSLLNDGRIFAYYGGARNLAVLPHWQRVGPDQAGGAPTQVPSGDFNGDGYSDIAVGYPTFNGPNGSQSGRAEAFYGGPHGLKADADWDVDGAGPRNRLGQGLAVVDLNGDGYEDLAVSSPGDPNQPGSEVVQIFFGGPDGLTPAANFALPGEQDGSTFGFALSSGGDVNGDGYGELLVGAPNFKAGNITKAGRAYLYFGSHQGISSDPPLTVSGTVHAGLLGREVTGGGDVNGDGYGDWLVSRPFSSQYSIGEGRVYVFLGGANPDTNYDSQLIGEHEYDHFGTSVSMGDANNDGITDVLVGAPGYSEANEPQLGKIYLYFGPIDSPQPYAPWRVTGTDDDSEFGSLVSLRGDVNGDGKSDVLASAPLFGEPTAGMYNEGRVHLYLAPHHFPVLDGSQDWAIEGNDPSSYMGMIATFAGDVNGDGFSDVILGSWGPGPSNTGLYLRLFNGNGSDGLPRAPRQARVDGITPVAPGGGSMGGGFAMQGLARSARGRERLRVQWAVVPAGETFVGQGLITGPIVDTGAPVAGEGSRLPFSEPMTDVTPGTLVHWRFRTLGSSPFFPARGRWMSLPGNRPNEADIRITAPGISGIPDGGSGPDGPGLRLLGPNPFRSGTTLGFDLPESGDVALSVFDVSGRLVRRLIDDRQSAGEHEVQWNGLNADGQSAPAGVYFARLEAGRGVATLRILKVW